MFPLNWHKSFNAKRDRSGGEHGCVLITAKNDFSFNNSDLTLEKDANLKIGQVNNFAVAISIVSVQSPDTFLLIYNPLSTLPHEIEANFLADWISSCHDKIDKSGPNSFSNLGDLNVTDLRWATINVHNCYSKRWILQTQQIKLSPLVLELTCKSSNTSHVILTSDSELLTQCLCGLSLLFGSIRCFCFVKLFLLLFKVSHLFGK